MMSIKINLPCHGGLGLKPQHYQNALDNADSGLWFEVHPENYMVDGGPRLAWLEAICQSHALSMHGVGLSLGGPDRPQSAHLARLKALVDRFQPAQVSEHVAWSRLGDVYFADLLPPPPTRATCTRLAAHISEVQDTLGRQILVENPSLYVPLNGDMAMVDLYVEAAKAAGAGLLFDINNIYVCARNVGGCAQDWLDAVPPDMVGEVHLAGFSPRTIGDEEILIDSHDAPISDDVWALYEAFIARAGARPTLIERDDNIPPFEELLTEVGRANTILQAPKKEAANG